MSRKLLLVDDESAITDMLSRHYRFQGYEVETAVNGADALEKLRAAPANVVISDIRMPVMDGAELCKQIQRHFPFTRVIMMTGHVSLDNALKCIRNGADHFVLKPLEDLTELDDAVKRSEDHLDRWKSVLKKLRSLDTGDSNGKEEHA